MHTHTHRGTHFTKLLPLNPENNTFDINHHMWLAFLMYLICTVEIDIAELRIIELKGYS